MPWLDDVNDVISVSTDSLKGYGLNLNDLPEIQKTVSLAVQSALELCWATRTTYQNNQYNVWSTLKRAMANSLSQACTAYQHKETPAQSTELPASQEDSKGTINLFEFRDFVQANIQKPRLQPASRKFSEEVKTCLYELMETTEADTLRLCIIVGEMVKMLDKYIKPQWVEFMVQIADNPTGEQKSQDLKNTLFSQNACGLGADEALVRT